MSFNDASHPEMRDDEVFITNSQMCNLGNIGWDTKRVGKVAYDPFGIVIQSSVNALFPVFAKRAELEERIKTLAGEDTNPLGIGVPFEIGVLEDMLERYPPTGEVPAVNNDNHPERRGDEVFLTNADDISWKTIGWDTKRRGVIAYGSDGAELGDKWHNSFPVFVQQSEIEIRDPAMLSGLLLKIAKSY